MTELSNEKKHEIVARLVCVAELYYDAAADLTDLLSDEETKQFVLSHKTTAWMEADRALRWHQIAREIKAAIK